MDDAREDWDWDWREKWQQQRSTGPLPKRANSCPSAMNRLGLAWAKHPRHPAPHDLLRPKDARMKRGRKKMPIVRAAILP